MNSLSDHLLQEGAFRATVIDFYLPCLNRLNHASKEGIISAEEEDKVTTAHVLNMRIGGLDLMEVELVLLCAAQVILNPHNQ